MTKPDFIVQNGNPGDDQIAWVIRTRTQLRAEGANYFRIAGDLRRRDA